MYKLKQFFIVLVLFLLVIPLSLAACLTSPDKDDPSFLYCYQGDEETIRAYWEGFGVTTTTAPPGTFCVYTDSAGDYDPGDCVPDEDVPPNFKCYSSGFQGSYGSSTHWAKFGITPQGDFLLQNGSCADGPGCENVNDCLVKGEGEYCQDNSFCRDISCSSDSDCPEDAICEEGKCIQLGDLDDSGKYGTRLATDTQITKEMVDNPLNFDCSDKTKVCDISLIDPSCKNIDVGGVGYQDSVIEDCWDFCIDKDGDFYCDSSSVRYEDWQDLSTNDIYKNFLGVWTQNILSEGIISQDLGVYWTMSKLEEVMPFDCNDDPEDPLSFTINPGVTEEGMCDLIDNDCDDEVDECRNIYPEIADGWVPPPTPPPEPVPGANYVGFSDQFAYGESKVFPEPPFVGEYNDCASDFVYFFVEGQGDELVNIKKRDSTSTTTLTSGDDYNHMLKFFDDPPSFRCKNPAYADWPYCYYQEKEFIIGDPYWNMGEIYWKTRPYRAECDLSGSDHNDGFCHNGFCKENPLLEVVLPQSSAAIQEAWEDYADEQGLSIVHECVYTLDPPACHVWDFDGDGYMNESFGCPLCTDCDDSDPEIKPGANDSDDDGKDDNCNTVADEMTDSDGDGIPDSYKIPPDTTPIILDMCETEGRVVAPVDFRGCWHSTDNNNLDGWSVD